MDYRIQSYLAEALSPPKGKTPKAFYCPCCDQHVKMSQRQIGQRGLKMLQQIYSGKPNADGWVSIRTVAVQGGDYAKLRHWDLIKKGPRKGQWRITSIGVEFLEGRHRVRKYALVYNNDFQGFRGPWVTVTEDRGQLTLLTIADEVSAPAPDDE